MNEWVNEWVSEGGREGVSEGGREWAKEVVDEWTSRWMAVALFAYKCFDRGSDHVEISFLFFFLFFVLFIVFFFWFSVVLACHENRPTSLLHPCVESTIRTVFFLWSPSLLLVLGSTNSGTELGPSSYTLLHYTNLKLRYWVCSATTVTCFASELGSRTRDRIPIDFSCCGIEGLGQNMNLCVCTQTWGFFCNQVAAVSSPHPLSKPTEVVAIMDESRLDFLRLQRGSSTEMLSQCWATATDSSSPSLSCPTCLLHTSGSIMKQV